MGVVNKQDRYRRARLAPCLALALALVSGCASYHPAPLPTPGALFVAPAPAVLSADAQTIRRPYLTPQPVDLAAPLTPNALAVIAVLENPDLKAQRAKTAVTDAQAFAARLLPDPTVQGSFDKLLTGSDPLNSYGSQLGFDLTQLRTRRVLRQSGDASKRQVRLDMAWAEWLTSGQARLLGARVVALDQQLPLIRASAESARHLFETANRAASRGDLSAGELDTRRQSLLDANARLLKAQSDILAARGDLNALLGIEPGTVLTLAAADPAPVPPAATILTAQAIDRRLDLQALRAGYNVAEADLHKAVLDQFPNLSLTVSYARDTAGNATIGPAVGFTLPLWNRNRGGIAIATATRAQLQAEYDARLFQTRTEISAAVTALAALRQQQADAASQLSALDRYATANSRAMKRGDLAQATAETSLQSLRDRQITLLSLRQQIAEQTIALELLSGGPNEGWTK